MAVDYTATVGGFDFGFNFSGQKIEVDSGLTSLSVGTLYSAIKEAQASEPGIVWPTIANGEGLANLASGVQTFLTVTLFDNWEVSSLKSSGRFEVSSGNLIRDDGNDPFLDNPSITYFNFLSQAGVLVSDGGGSAPTAADIADAVWDEAAADHETAGTMGELLKKAKLFAQNSFTLSA